MDSQFSWAVKSQIFTLLCWNSLWVYKRNSGSFSVLLIEKCILKQTPLAIWRRLHSNLWILNIRMYKPWATVNIFIVSFLHLLQGSDYENGSMKVGDLYLLLFLIIQIARITYVSCARWWSFCWFAVCVYFVMVQLHRSLAAVEERIIYKEVKSIVAV